MSRVVRGIFMFSRMKGGVPGIPSVILLLCNFYKFEFSKGEGVAGRTPPPLINSSMDEHKQLSLDLTFNL